jgi:hypothetical protein
LDHPQKAWLKPQEPLMILGINNAVNRNMTLAPRALSAPERQILALGVLLLPFLGAYKHLLGVK